MNPQHDDDPFGGYGLPGRTQASSTEPAEVQPVAPQPAAPQPAAPRYELPPPAAFEVQAERGRHKCEECFHYVPGGALSIDHVYEAQTVSLYSLILKCKEFEKSFEVQELQEIVEKAKTLDEKFDGRPHVRGYCAAGRADSESLSLIAEIKNHDGKCAEFLPGRAPVVSCTDCGLRRPAALEPPSLTDYPIDWGEDNDRDFHFYGGGKAMSDYIETMRGQYKRQEMHYQRDEDEYKQKLQNDIVDAIFNDRAPMNDTLDSCRNYPFRACAVQNRSLRCTDFRTQQEQKLAEFTKSLGAGPKRAETDRDKKNLRNHVRLSIQNKDFFAESDRVRKATYARNIERPALTEEQKRIPCFDCVHRRDPVNVDPFTTVHFNDAEIMALRDQFRREQLQKANEERHLCAVPGPSLGNAEVPSRNIWCDLHSRRQADGKVQEYAYCYRVLKATAPDGQCPGFRSRYE